jgi:hypothetical protein
MSSPALGSRDAGFSPYDPAADWLPNRGYFAQMGRLDDAGKTIERAREIKVAEVGRAYR